MDRNDMNYKKEENGTDNTPKYTEEMKNYFDSISDNSSQSSHSVGQRPTQVPIEEVRKVTEVEDVKESPVSQGEAPPSSRPAAPQPSAQGTPPPSGNYTQSPNHTTPQYPPYPGYVSSGGQPPQPPKKPKKKRTGLKVFAVILAIVLSLGVGSGVTYYALRESLTDHTIPPAVSEAEQDTPVPEEPVEEDDSLQSSTVPSPHTSISSVATEVLPQVVEVMTESVTVNPFFGELITSGAGSGVIISDDGYIITNNHVVDTAQGIQVTTHEGEEYEAELIGRDKETDLAILKIQGENLPAATFGDSDQLIVGDLAIVVGNPLGTLGGTVTDGIISALNREITIDNQKMTLIQTSAAVNQGNSGGGLFDANGNLVGIINAKSSGSGIEGLGFAIPSNLAKEIAKQIMDVGYVSGRPQIGITVLEAYDQTTLRRYQLSEYGLYVMEVSRDIDLEPLDLIQAIDGQEIESNADVQSILQTKKAGDVLTMQIKRNGRSMEVSIELGEKLPDHIKTPQTANTSA